MVTPESKARRAWAKSMLERCASWPTYGSPEWLALPEGSPERVAGVIAAAESWMYDADMLEVQAAAEARWVNYLHGEAVSEHRADYGSKSYRPHPANREVA